MKDRINRNDIKKNFLKRVLFRIDYTGLSNMELEIILNDIKINYENYFKDYNKEIINSYDIQMNDVTVKNEELNLVKLGDKYTHVFSHRDSCDRYTMRFSEQFMYLDIYPSTEYKGNDIYYGLFSRLYNTFNKIKFFNINRVGIRKFNNFFIEADRVEELKNIFSNDFFSLYIPNDYEISKKTMMDSFIKKNFNVNFIREISLGTIENEKKVYLVAFDLDIYSNDKLFLKNFKDNVETNLIKMNDIIFNFFIETMNENFINNVLVNQSKRFKDYGIVEGEDNEQ